MITVIIPAWNEEKSISSVVQHCRVAANVSEVIVVDDNSTDKTVDLALEYGARVIRSKKQGKGISMREGLEAASNEIIVFLDGDINPYPENTVEKLTEPLLNASADFVKGSFSRNAGRVTTLVAKPLLSIFYPELSRFEQPLSGMIAGKKEYFGKLDIINDYGVDIGILIDMYLMRIRITEVNIGHIENKSKPWQALGKMSNEVSRAIITKAHRISPDLFDEKELMKLEVINSEMNEVLEDELSALRKMAVLDMDDTILRGRFIDHIAKAQNFTDKLHELRQKETDPVILTKRIGLLLKGVSMEDMLQVVSSIPLVDDIIEVVRRLKEKKYVVGIISNSYQLITNYVKQQIGADFSFANKLEYYEGRATGEVNMPSYFFASPDSICGHGYCKTNVMQYACDKYQVQLKNVIAVGDSKDDRCMITYAGKGYAFCSKDDVLKKLAFRAIEKPSFETILE